MLASCSVDSTLRCAPLHGLRRRAVPRSDCADGSAAGADTGHRPAWCAGAGAPFGYAPPPPGYANPYGYTPTRAEGYLNGIAAVTTASADYQQQIQQAKLTQEQVERSKLDTRRAIYDEMQYEYKNRRTSDQVVAEDQAARLKRSRNNPPSTIIWSGDALNDLLMGIHQTEDHCGVSGPQIPLNPQVLQRINVTAGTTPGTIGLFRTGGPLRWPLPLLDDRFTPLRTNIDNLVGPCIESVLTGVLDAKKLQALLKAIDELKDAVAAATNDQTPSDNIAAMRYANQLYQAARLADRRQRREFLQRQVGSPRPDGRRADHVSVEQRPALRPAADGDEPSYSALYRSLLEYDTAMLRMTSR